MKLEVNLENSAIVRKRFKELRNERKLTQEEYGQKLGISRESVLRFEKGKREITRSVMLRLNEYTGVSMAWIGGHSNARQDISNRELERLYNKLNEENKVKIIIYITNMLNSEGEKYEI